MNDRSIGASALRKPPRRVLVIGLRRLGDLLLATALIRTLKQAWPDSRIDVLTVAGSEGVLEGNEDVAEVLSFVRGSGSFALLRRIFRHYDLAVNLQPEDRGHLLALAAAPVRIAIVPPRGQSGWRWKRWFSTAHVEVNLHTQHAVVQYLQLADLVGLPRQTALVPPASTGEGPVPAPPSRPYAVVHPFAMYRYKAWQPHAWRQVIDSLIARGMTVVITGGPAAEERRAIAALLSDCDEAGLSVTDLSGQLRFSELAGLLADASLFIGPDTSVTHLAAACGTPVIALLGPSNPVAWGPWPISMPKEVASPWIERSARQQIGNVTLLQGTRARYPGCIPCMKEGCEGHRDSPSDCLDGLPAERVIIEMDALLA